MNDKVDASPGAMRDFAGYLKDSNHKLTDEMNYLSSRLGALGDTWKDAYYEQFENAFREAATQVNRFLDQSEIYVQYLNQKATPLEDYGSIRTPR